MRFLRLAMVALLYAAMFSQFEAVAGPVGGGLDDPGAAASADKCQRAIKKSARTLVAKKLKELGKCASQVSKCIQTKNSNAQCLVKAGATCESALAKVAAAQGKVSATIAQKCSALSADDLLRAAGLADGLIGIECVAEFGTVVTDAVSVGQCVARQQDCRAGRLLSFEHPRIDASLDLVGVDGGADSCFTNYGGDGDVGDPGGLGKDLVKCGDAVRKAGAKFVLAKLGSLEKCVDAVFTCIQKKPDDQPCVTKARAKCDKAFSKIADARGQLSLKITSKCGGVAFQAINADNGGDVTGLGVDCAAHGVAPIASLADYETCLVRTHDCLTEELMFLEAPRAGELLGLVGHVLSSPFCPAPSACQVPIHVRFRRYSAGTGAVFFDRTVDFNYTGGTVVLSAEPDGNGEVFVDDEILVTVTRPDQTTAEFDHDYSNGCSGSITHTAPHDLSALFQLGINQVRVRFKNTCGANASADSYWLVGCGGM
jgi:hypothetical protein